MSWEITVNIDRDKTDVGSVSATWTDPDVDLGTFSFSKRTSISIADADIFIAEAIAARDAWQVWKTSNNTKAAWALNRLNTADPKVV